MQLSRRLSDARMQEKELNRSAEQLILAVELGRWQPFPARITPAPVPMRPDASPDPAVETLEEACGCGAFVITRPNPAGVDLSLAIKFLGSSGVGPFGAFPYLIHETTNRLLLGIRIERILSGLTTNLVAGQIASSTRS